MTYLFIRAHWRAFAVEMNNPSLPLITDHPALATLL